jgi:hypothetical protein
MHPCTPCVQANDEGANGGYFVFPALTVKLLSGFSSGPRNRAQKSEAPLPLMIAHFLANEWDKTQAQKRGGRVKVIPLQPDTAETRYLHEPADEDTPDKAFDRRWACFNDTSRKERNRPRS